MTRKRLNMYEEIWKSGNGLNCLYDCYKRPSYKKETALDRCLAIKHSFGNTSMGYILTFNRCMFTYGFYAYSPKASYFVVITKTGVHMKPIKLNYN